MPVETQIFTAYTEGVPTHRASWHNPGERDDNLGNESPRIMSRSYWLPLKSTIVASLCGSFPERYPVSVESQTLRQSLFPSSVRPRSSVRLCVDSVGVYLRRRLGVARGNYFERSNSVATRNIFTGGCHACSIQTART